MNTLTLILEVILGAVGVTVAIGAPLVGMLLHHRGTDARTDASLVATARGFADVSPHDSPGLAVA